MHARRRPQSAGRTGQLMLLASSIAAACTLTAAPLGAQVAPEFRTGPEKVAAKTFARLRAEFGLVDSAHTRAEAGATDGTIAHQLTGGVEGSDGSRDFSEAVREAVRETVRRPLDVLDLALYDPEALGRIEASALGVERSVHEVLVAFADCRVEAGEARHLLMDLFRNYLNDLQAIPLGQDSD